MVSGTVGWGASGFAGSKANGTSAGVPKFEGQWGTPPDRIFSPPFFVGSFARAAPTDRDQAWL